jgi:hypothetical protein
MLGSAVDASGAHNVWSSGLPEIAELHLAGSGRRCKASKMAVSPPGIAATPFEILESMVPLSPSTFETSSLAEPSAFSVIRPG